MKTSILKNLPKFVNSSLPQIKINFKSFLFIKYFSTINRNINNFYKLPCANFAKKGNDKNDKKAKKEKEKENISREYENISVDELKSKYKNKADTVLANLKDALNEIRVQRSNPKILDNIMITMKNNKRMKLVDLATIMLRAANVMVINPFDESHKDMIIKSIESSKLDVQITTEGNGIVVTIGAITDDAKTESLQKTRKLQDSSKEELKTIRHSCVSEMKKLEKILGQDEARRIEKGILDHIEKANKQVEQLYRKKEEEIKSS